MPKTSVISVDLQYDFFDIRQDRVGRIEKALCLPGSRRLIQHARLNKSQLIHVVTGHRDSNSLPLHLAKVGQQPYCLEGTEGAQNINGLFADSDLKVQKTQYSGFFGTNLADHLLGCDTLILCGIATDCCILHTAFDAASYRKHVYVPYQAVFATTPEAYVFGLQAIAKSAGTVVDLEALLKEPGKPWEARLQAEEIKNLAGEWYSIQAGLLENFKAQRSELFALPTASPQEIVASLEAFLSARAVP
jgi:nicotinamidase-related amidase